MYAAKQAGKNRYHLFDPSHDQRVKANQGALRKIDRALSENQFLLFYQPQVDCRRGCVTGAEALIRWRHPVLGMLTPAEFLPLIEQDDLIVTLGEWVIGKALTQIDAWLQQGIDLRVSVNVSARQLHQSAFPARLRAMMAAHSQDIVGRLEMEIVETAALEDINAVADAIDECHALGIRVALDDFGTGFSSLVHLKRLAADVLKIDQAFVADMLEDPEDLAIVEGVVGLANAFKRQVVAEGVETIDHILLLMELGCSVMQGFGLARPMAAEKIPDWLRSFQPDPLWNLSASPRPSRDYFELLLAEANHRHWIDQVVSSIRQQGSSRPEEVTIDDQSCRFGQWYYKEGARRFRSLPEFVAIERIHQAIHRQAARLCADHLADRKEEVRRGEMELMALHKEMVALLRQLRVRLAEEMLRKAG
jgi:EAL domain-containing protein (putative c-di-GMP-specific phosphodiesterase class I)